MWYPRHPASRRAASGYNSAVSSSYSAGPVRPARQPAKGAIAVMKEHVYKTIELTGTSEVSQEAAVQNAVAKAAGTVRNMRWFEVVSNRGAIENGRVAQWQVTVKVSFTLED